MSEFWMGVLVIPAAMVAMGVAYCAVKWLGDLGGRAAASVLKLTPDSSEQQRANVGAVIYSGHKVWLLGLGNLGIAFVSGQGSRDAVAASKRLAQHRKLSLRKDFLAASSSPASSGTSAEGAEL